MRAIYPFEPHTPNTKNAPILHRFMSGSESHEYLDDPENHSVYDVNTIANYDPQIIPLLDAPIGSAFERNPKSGMFVEVEFEAPED